MNYAHCASYDTYNMIINYTIDNVSKPHDDWYYLTG